jgi:hypothetical protein
VAVVDLRLRRLERARRDHHGVFFLAIGRDDTEIEAAIANARARLTLQLNDLVVRLPWHEDNMPQSRWILTRWSQPGVGETLSKAERNALEERTEQLCGKPPSRSRLAGVAITSSKFAASGPVAQWSDEQLIAGILGEPVTDDGVDHEPRTDEKG